MYLFRNQEVKKFFLYTILISAAGMLLSCLLVSSAAAGIVFLTSLALHVIWILQLKNRYGQIRQLSLQLDEILHGSTGFDLSHFSEGDLEILRDEIYKMTVRLREQAERLDKEKTRLADFLADISHQVRTPLTSLFLMTERLRKADGMSSGNRVLLRQIEQMLHRIEWLVTALLKISRLDAGAVEFDLQDNPLGELVKDALEPLEISMELHRITCIVEGDTSIRLCCDRTWTLEALGNVLKNSTQYTPPGGSVTISMEQNPLYTEITVTDSGNGIPEEDLPHLFERFYRGKNSGRDSFGIGLALARMILACENAVILARNTPDGSGRFILRFYPVSSGTLEENTTVK